MPTNEHKVPTVRVKDEGFEEGVLINEADFVVGKHELYEPPKRRTKKDEA